MAQQVDITDGQGKEIFVYENHNSGRNRRALTVDPAGHILTSTVVYAANQTNTTILTPASGTKLCIRDIYVGVDNNAGDVELDFNTSNIVVFRIYATRFQNWSGVNMHIEGAIDEVLSVTTTTGANNLFILINYIEEV